MSDGGTLKSLTLFTRQHCPLCDHLALALELLRLRRPFEYRKVDVDSDPALAATYGVRVPVLLDGTTEVCAGSCDPAVVEAYLEAG
jgi:glutaredoxin